VTQEIAGPDNELLDDIIRLMDEIHTPHQTVPLPNGYELTNLLPSGLLSGLGYTDCELIEESHSYWTYNGSLTTAPYTECVKWTILKQPLQISTSQVLLAIINVFNNFTVGAHEKSRPAQRSQPPAARCPTDRLLRRLIKVITPVIQLVVQTQNNVISLRHVNTHNQTSTVVC
jgi:hypothetical protein